jgi:predicted TIM-barrel fold metal-dependent hydrolase
MKAGLTLLVLLIAAFSCGKKAKDTISEEGPGKIIDIHMHAMTLSSPCVYCAYTTDPLLGARIFSKDSTSPCEHLLTSPAKSEELQKEIIRQIKKNNIVYAVISGFNRERMKELKAALPELFILGVSGEPLSERIDSVRNRIIRGEIKVLGELGTQYAGLSLNIPEYDPFMTLAEEYDIPVISHCGPGLPGGTFGKYRAAVGNPLNYEDLLVNHPKLRICLAHAGWPLADEMIALLFNYPNVYVDISYINYAIPKKVFQAYLKRIIDAGFSKRILFGSDLILWPEVIDLAINSIKSSEFLSEQQKRDIFYNNAARFLKIKE